MINLIYCKKGKNAHCTYLYCDIIPWYVIFFNWFTFWNLYQYFLYKLKFMLMIKNVTIFVRQVLYLFNIFFIVLRVNFKISYFLLRYFLCSPSLFLIQSIKQSFRMLRCKKINVQFAMVSFATFFLTDPHHLK